MLVLELLILVLDFALHLNKKSIWLELRTAVMSASAINMYLLLRAYFFYIDKVISIFLMVILFKRVLCFKTNHFPTVHKLM